MCATYDPSLLDKLLPDYYKNIFPFKPYCKWLCYNKKSTEYFNRREFAFIFEGDTHLRFRSFEQPAEFEKDLCARAPQKLDVGAVYNHCPKDNKKFSDFKAVERELVFDIDLTDYDTVRSCCSEAKVCEKCWKFVVAAVLVLDRALDEDFGFKARMWVFSGRRGVHCWVGDEKARKLNNTGRAAVAEYLSLIQAEKLQLHTSKSVKRSVHPFIDDSYKLLMSSGLIDEMVEEQKWLYADDLTPIFGRMEDKELQERVLNDLKEINEPALRWNYLKLFFDEDEKAAATASGGSAYTGSLSFDKDFLKWFVLYHVYPRLDVNVSTGVNHLLKSPFCIHPKTGNVAVPLNIETIRDFDVNGCPRIDVLMKELSESMKSDDVKENRKILGYKHTSLAQYVENFERFVDIATVS